MKKILLLMSLFVAFGLAVNAQYYYMPYVNAGQNPGNINQDAEYPVAGGIPAGWTSIQAGSAATPAWSSINTVPF
ncbi:MAG: hypothetical protein NT126_12760, partial [Bacteroidetes bacterium]|nr:hypothetical protein [Bacteroidota bacterium]